MTITDQIPELKLEGRSGCSLNIFSNKGIYTVRKTSSSSSYSDRLKKQAAKQAGYKNNTGNSFTAPKVLNEETDSNGIFHFDMEYVHGEKFSDFLSRATVTDIEALYSLFTSYFDNLFSNSQTQQVNSKVIEEKVAEIEGKLANNNFYSIEFKNQIINKIANQIPKGNIPLGTCHGDFTFSNILFSNSSKVYIFDFLDSFIESPIIDLVKIRQDTKFYWSVEIDTHLDNAKKGRVMQVLQHLDKKFEQYLATNYAQFQDWYTYLEFFNLVRIIPYAHQIRDVHFLQKNLKKLIF